MQIIGRPSTKLASSFPSNFSLAIRGSPVSRRVRQYPCSTRQRSPYAHLCTHSPPCARGCRPGRTFHISTCRLQDQSGRVRINKERPPEHRTSAPRRPTNRQIPPRTCRTLRVRFTALCVKRAPLDCRITDRRATTRVLSAPKMPNDSPHVLSTGPSRTAPVAAYRLRGEHGELSRHPDD